MTATVRPCPECSSLNEFVHLNLAPDLPSQIHPSYPYGNPFKDKTLTAAAFPTNPVSTRARYEDAEFEGIGPKSKRRWKDLGLDMLLPPISTDRKAKTVQKPDPEQRLSPLQPSSACSDQDLYIVHSAQESVILHESPPAEEEDEEDEDEEDEDEEDEEDYEDLDLESMGIVTGPS